MTKEKPILFSTPMVQAILAGRKTQTRRILKSQPDSRGLRTTNVMWEDWHGKEVKCPYGQIGDVLWVRETWSPIELESGTNYRYKASFVENTGLHPKWKPSIFMPREACRIRLEITDIRVERVWDISDKEARHEGIEPEGEGWKSYEIIHSGRHKGEMNPHSDVPNRSPVTSYKELWESINGKDSWNKNPWVWIITFKKL